VFYSQQTRCRYRASDVFALGCDSFAKSQSIWALLGLVFSAFTASTVGCGGPQPSPPLVVANPSGTGTASVRVELIGFRSDQGRALVALYRSETGFPEVGATAFQTLDIEIVSGRAQANFTGIPPGQAAVAVLHDQDGDKKMKTGLLGRPLEGYGISRDARARFGPPSFADAAITLEANTTVNIKIHMRY